MIKFEDIRKTTIIEKLSNVIVEFHEQANDYWNMGIIEVGDEFVKSANTLSEVIENIEKGKNEFIFFCSIDTWNNFESDTLHNFNLTISVLEDIISSFDEDCMFVSVSKDGKEVAVLFRITSSEEVAVFDARE